MIPLIAHLAVLGSVYFPPFLSGSDLPVSNALCRAAKVVQVKQLPGTESEHVLVSALLEGLI